MMKILIPVILALLGFVGGAGAAWFLKPPPEPEADTCLDAHGQEMTGEACADEGDEDAHAEDTASHEEASDSEYVPLERQFIVPVVSEDRVSSMMVLQLNLEVDPGTVEEVFQREPKLRDALLRALFEHAYTGGFTGDFTADHVMRELRRNLVKAAQGVVGPSVRDVLVADIIKQDQ